MARHSDRLRRASYQPRPRREFPVGLVVMAVVGCGLGGAYVALSAHPAPVVVTRPPPAPATTTNALGQIVTAPQVQQPAQPVTEPVHAAQPPPVAQPAPAPAPPPAQGDSLEEAQARYVARRTQEMLETRLAGVPSHMVSDAALAQIRAQVAAEAQREWEALCVVLGMAEVVGEEKGDVDLYRRAADYAWPDIRDLADAGGTISRDLVRRLLAAHADQALMERRINGH